VERQLVKYGLGSLSPAVIQWFWIHVYRPELFFTN